MDELLTSISTKSKSWKYENEIRILSLNKNNSHSYTPNSLLEIVVGDKMPDDQQTLIKNIAHSVNPNIILKKAKLKKESYNIEIVNF
ncbi:hypothetical protein TYM08_P1339 [Marinicellulosiphila megalodicopiae]